MRDSPPVPAPCRAVRAALLALCSATLLAHAAPRALAQVPPSSKVPLEDLLKLATPTILDEGRLVVSQGGKAVRAEDFSFQKAGRALLVTASSTVSAPGAAERPVDKNMVLIMDAADYAIEKYRSAWVLPGDTLWRGVAFEPGDTVSTLWRESTTGGSGDRVPMPPGRIYVLDPPLFTTFSVIARSLHGKVCDHRPIKVLVLGARDSVVDATVNEIGNETIRWGARPVVARKLVIGDRQTDFVAWVGPDGRLLRLEQPTTGIRVDRAAPPLKKRAPRPH